MYLLLKSQKENWSEIVEVSRFEVLRACQMNTGKREYLRLEESLKRWKMLTLEFHDTFYDGKKYQTINFGIIDSWEIE